MVFSWLPPFVLLEVSNLGFFHPEYKNLDFEKIFLASEKQQKMHLCSISFPKMNVEGVFSRQLNFAFLSRVFMWHFNFAPKL